MNFIIESFTVVDGWFFFQFLVQNFGFSGQNFDFYFFRSFFSVFGSTFRFFMSKFVNILVLQVKIHQNFGFQVKILIFTFSDQFFFSFLVTILGVLGQNLSKFCFFFRSKFWFLVFSDHFFQFFSYNFGFSGQDSSTFWFSGQNFDS